MNTIEFGDCREIMRAWKKQGVRVQTCVTSPPYYGLRDYGHSGQIGLEKTPEEYIAVMVEVFRCVWDVLADDGTLWVNIGDSYAASAKNRTPEQATKNTGLGGSVRTQCATLKQQNKVTGALKNKDLIGIPWALAFALRADGWYLRQDIIWSKPNPMPESVKDRCTKSHEYLFLLTKAKKYYFNGGAISEPVAEATLKDRVDTGVFRRGRGFPGAPSAGGGRLGDKDTRNKRSVWTVTPKPYKGAHFATFPPDLIEPCILAGSRPGDIVLDPFMGSGTTAAVAVKHGRNYLGCEINPEYAPLQTIRILDI